MGSRALIRAFAFHKFGTAKEIQPQETMMEVDVKRTLKSVTFWAPDAKWTEFESMDLENMFKWTKDQALEPCIFRVYSSRSDWNLLLSKVLHKGSQLVDTESLDNKYSDTSPWLIKLARLRGFRLNTRHHYYRYRYRRGPYWGDPWDRRDWADPWDRRNWDESNDPWHRRYADPWDRRNWDSTWGTI
jgi:hypothetical protein